SLVVIRSFLKIGGSFRYIQRSWTSFLTYIKEGICKIEVT
ncbi:1916_t:CDS:1, partial [Gigaspora rosea]